MPTIDYLTGFNHRIASLDATQTIGAGGTIAIDTDIARKGGTSLKITNGASSLTRQVYSLSRSSNTAVAVVYAYISTLPSTVSDIFGFFDSSTNKYIGIGMGGDNFFELTYSTDGSGASSRDEIASAVSTGNWYRFELSLDGSTSTWATSFGIATDNKSLTTGTDTISASGSLTFDKFFIGGLFFSSGSVINFTDMAISLQSADYPIGPISVLGYSPTSVGTHNLDASTSSYFFSETQAPPGGTTTALTTSETTSYQSIDDIALDGGTDAVKVTTAVGPPNTPTFRSAGTWSFAANNVANPLTLTPGAPAGKAVGDLLLLVCESRSITATVATPSGWNLLTNFPKRSGTASGGTIYLFSRIADGTGNDTPSPIWSGLTTGTSGDASGAGILAFTNLTETQDATAISQDLSAQGSTSSITGITTVTNNSMVINVEMKLLESSGQTSTVTTYTERSDNSTTSGTGHIVATSSLVKTPAGASGSGTVTWSGTTSARALIATIALKATTSTLQPTNTWYAEYGFGISSRYYDNFYGTDNAAYGIKSTAGTDSGILEQFVADFGILKSVILNLSKAGVPTGQLQCQIRDVNGTTTIATADATLDVSTLTTSPLDYTFTFASGVTLSTGTVYSIVLTMTSGSLSGVNYVAWENNTTDSIAGLGAYTSNNGGTSWGSQPKLCRYKTQYIQVSFSSDPYAARAIVAQELDTAVSSTWAAKLYDSVQGSNTEDISNSSISTTTKTYVGKTFPGRPAVTQTVGNDSSGSVFGDTSSDLYLATSFVLSTTGLLRSVTLYLQKFTGSPSDNVVATVYADNAGVPGTVLGSALIAGSSLTSSTAAYSFDVGRISLVSGTTYWVGVNRSGAADAANYYLWTNGGSGTLVPGSAGPTWGVASGTAGHADILIETPWTLAALNSTRLRFGYTAAASGRPRLAAAMLEAAFPIRSFIFDTRRVQRNNLLRR